MLSYPQHSATLFINIKAICDNWRQLDNLSDKACQTGAVVKANAYGLGMVPISLALYKAGCRLFFTARLHEAITLAQAFEAQDIKDAHIIVFDGMLAGQEAAYRAYPLVPVINDLDQLARIKAFCQHDKRPLTKPMNVALHIDTAMARLGLEAKDWQALQNDADWQDGLNIILLMSHLASADDKGAAQNQSQLALFKSLTNDIKAPLSLANSGGSYLGADFEFDATRPGIALYGLSPHDDHNHLKCALRLSADILQIRQVETGATVGYGASFTAPAPMRLATLGIGYADGFLRHYKDHVTPHIGGIACPLVGRISMDSCVIDVSHLSEDVLNTATSAVIFDEDFTPKDLAQKTGTISYEIITSLGARILRLYDEGDV